VDPQTCPNFRIWQMAIPLPNATTRRVRSGPKMSEKLKTRRSAVVAFPGSFHQIALPLPPKLPPKPNFGGPFNAKPITDIPLRNFHDNGATKLKLYSYISISKYLSVCQFFSARERPKGAGPPNVHLGPI